MKGNEPLFGEKLAKYTIDSDELNGARFYLVSGQWGPTPGPSENYGATRYTRTSTPMTSCSVWPVTSCQKEPKYTSSSKTQKTAYATINTLTSATGKPVWDKPFPLNQVKRLQQRCDKINELFKKDKEHYRRALFIHLDSRSESKQIDVFFYHYDGSAKGKHLANTLQNVFNRKYDKHQSLRGFSGTVSPRDLFVIKQSLPVAVFVELGNIQNSRDQQRFLLDDNRQALANWMCEGLIEDYKNYKNK